MADMCFALALPIFPRSAGVPGNGLPSCTGAPRTTSHATVEIPRLKTSVSNAINETFFAVVFSGRAGAPRAASHPIVKISGLKESVSNATNEFFFAVIASCGAGAPRAASHPPFPLAPHHQSSAQVLLQQCHAGVLCHACGRGAWCASKPTSMHDPQLARMPILKALSASSSFVGHNVALGTGGQDVFKALMAAFRSFSLLKKEGNLMFRSISSALQHNPEAVATLKQNQGAAAASFMQSEVQLEVPAAGPTDDQGALAASLTHVHACLHKSDATTAHGKQGAGAAAADPQAARRSWGQAGLVGKGHEDVPGVPCTAWVRVSRGTPPAEPFTP
eukprot:1155570-Pelagomonas_calceolata.AAC.1